jgi:hypothetical protein
VSRIRSIWNHRGGCREKGLSKFEPLIDLAMAEDHVLQTAGPHLDAVAKELMKAQGMNTNVMTV